MRRTRYEFASRQCDEDGQWMGHPEKENINGWSNYSDCFTKEIKLLLDKLYTSSQADVEALAMVRLALLIFGFWITMQLDMWVSLDYLSAREAQHSLVAFSSGSVPLAHRIDDHSMMCARSQKEGDRTIHLGPEHKLL
ncbi:uncharacterized protein CDAR_85711 [Caerostris darwini]|uniref:Uncharacterized protein n=1 Tax=Caerostris darwini TaxID=1538125 RepID=A0AAV4QGL3_9ARAC|nr:uncharacterized protein CDAR_85711 [Caerostris darwini]